MPAGPVSGSGNALDLGQVAGEEPFHIVVGVWLLKYASEQDKMTSMYRTISANLQDGGVFMAIIPPPTEDVDERVKSWAETTEKHLDILPARVDYYERLESGQGWKTELTSLTKGAQFSFRNFHLRRNVYEAAGGGGVRGKLCWKEPVIPEQVASARDEFSKLCLEIRYMGLLVVEK